MPAKKVVNVHEAKTHLSQLLEEVRQGAEITIAKAGKPCAKLTSLTPFRKRELGFVTGKVHHDDFAPLSEEDLKSWYESDGASLPAAFATSSRNPAKKRAR